MSYQIEGRRIASRMEYRESSTEQTRHKFLSARGSTHSYENTAIERLYHSVQ